MSGQEIRNQIDANNERIRRALRTFVLTDEINQLMEDNVSLRLICKHEFENGFCRFCDTPIDFVEEE